MVIPSDVMFILSSWRGRLTRTAAYKELGGFLHGVFFSLLSFVMSGSGFQ